VLFAFHVMRVTMVSVSGVMIVLARLLDGLGAVTVAGMTLVSAVARISIGRILVDVAVAFAVRVPVAFVRVRAAF